ncbi:MAG: 6-bladed beta-propeller [Candidatus Aminicenantes bacterium]|nr:6-bladed beta-propeller [Candidatus Aminicenantes bacterium]
MKNGRVPLNPDGGRVLNIEEVLRIPGEGDGYFFSSAARFDIDGKGNIYIGDFYMTGRPIHFLKFAADGAFIKDLYKQGEGPGEISSFFEFALGEDIIFVYDGNRQKLMKWTLEGELIKEDKLESGRLSEVLGLYNGQLVVVRDEYPVERNKNKLYDIGHPVILLETEGLTSKTVHQWSHKIFLIATKFGGGMMVWAPKILTMMGNKIAACTTCEYLVEVYDLEKEKIIVRFNRRYPRLKYKMPDRMKEFIKKYNAPKRKYENDIKNLHLNDDFIWVETSTIDEEKGKLFDLFDFEGLPIIVKYRIRKVAGMN